MSSQMAMQDLVIDKKGIRLSCQRALLTLHHDSFIKPIHIPLTQISSITLTCQLELSSTLLTQLSKAQISLCVIPASTAGEPAFLLGDWHAAVTRRQWQYDCIRTSSSRQQWAMQIIRLKLHQQASCLYNMLNQLSDYPEYTPLLTNLDDVSILKSMTQIKSLRDKLKPYRIPHLAKDNTDTPSISSISEPAHPVHDLPVDSNVSRASSKTYFRTYPTYTIDSLLGTEGTAASLYFSAYRQLFDPALNFCKRQRRPPPDPVNVILSLSYTLLTNICQHAIFSIGFDPYAGIVHSVAYNRASLACDLAELQRQFIDQWVWRLFASDSLQLQDFSKNSDSLDMQSRPYQLLKVGRQKFYAAFAKIRATLLTTATGQAWLWQKRLEQQFATDSNRPTAQSLTTVNGLVGQPNTS